MAPKRYLITTEVAAHSPTKRASFGVYDQKVVVGSAREAAKAAITAARSGARRVSSMEAVRVRVSEQKEPGSTDVGKTLMVCDQATYSRRTRRHARDGRYFARCETPSKAFRRAVKPKRKAR